MYLAVRLEKIMEPEPNKSYPVCTGGKRAGPPEDCGGPWAYQELLHLARNPFPELQCLGALEILGRGFDPEAFDRREVNALLGSRFHFDNSLRKARRQDGGIGR